jgi:hypothetical protein
MSGPDLPSIVFFMRPKTISRIAKNARNILNATACEIMEHWGITLVSVCDNFLESGLAMYV